MFCSGDSFLSAFSGLSNSLFLNALGFAKCFCNIGKITKQMHRGQAGILPTWLTFSASQSPVAKSSPFGRWLRRLTPFTLTWRQRLPRSSKSVRDLFLFYKKTLPLKSTINNNQHSSICKINCHKEKQKQKTHALCLITSGGLGITRSRVHALQTFPVFQGDASGFVGGLSRSPIQPLGQLPTVLQLV